MPSANITYCPEESVDYICTGYGVVLEFIAPPYVNATNAISFLSSDLDSPPVLLGDSVSADLTNATQGMDGQYELVAQLTLKIPLGAPRVSFIQCNVTASSGESNQSVFYTVQG